MLIMKILTNKHKKTPCIMLIVNLIKIKLSQISRLPKTNHCLFWNADTIFSRVRNYMLNFKVIQLESSLDH